MTRYYVFSLKDLTSNYSYGLLAEQLRKREPTNRPIKMTKQRKGVHSSGRIPLLTRTVNEFILAGTRYTTHVQLISESSFFKLLKFPFYRFIATSVSFCTSRCREHLVYYLPHTYVTYLLESCTCRKNSHSCATGTIWKRNSSCNHVFAPLHHLVS